MSFAVLGQVKRSLASLNPQEVRSNAERPVRVGLVAPSPAALGRMETFFVPPHLSPDRRVEALCPVHDRHLADHLRNVVLATLLRDVTRAHVLQPNGTYIEAESLDSDHVAVDSQEMLLAWYATEHRLAQLGQEGS